MTKLEVGMRIEYQTGNFGGAVYNSRREIINHSDFPNTLVMTGVITSIKKDDEDDDSGLYRIRFQLADKSEYSFTIEEPYQEALRESTFSIDYQSLKILN